MTSTQDSIDELGTEIRKLADLRTVADRSVASIALWQSFIAVVVGLGYITSDFAPGDRVVQWEAYTYIERIPGWPWTIGVLCAVFGALCICADLSHKLARIRSLLYIAQALFWLVYGVLFVAGTVRYGGFWGPQFFSLGFSVVCLLQSYYTRAVERI